MVATCNFTEALSRYYLARRVKGSRSIGYIIVILSSAQCTEGGVLKKDRF